MVSFLKRNGRLLFYAVALILVAAFLWFSNRIVKDLAEEERKKMEVWAEAIRLFTSNNSLEGEALSFVAQVMEGNTTIPVVLCDVKDSVLTHSNIELNVANEEALLQKKVAAMKAKGQQIVINIDPDTRQYLYYGDSNLLMKLAYFPYIQLSIMIAFISVAYFSIRSARKAEQDRVWVGLSKETAHQLGTPISSLLAWIELMRIQKVDVVMLEEMEKDASRLKTIAERFSKIGSKPLMKEEDLSLVVMKAVEYMRRRISEKVEVSTYFPSEPMLCLLSAPLIEWVVENLSKNAIDAIEGAGTLSFVMKRVGDRAVLDVSDSGRGIPLKQQKTVFEAGYTTKSRGWGLGLTLARRIIGEYHRGKIYILHSEVGKGTTFRIEIPLSEG